MKVVILMTSGPRTPWRCASPFYIAALMSANEAEVEVFFNMDGTKLLKRGVAERLLPAEPNCLSPNGKKLKTVYDFMKDAKQAGVKFYSCKQAIDSMGYKPEDLIPELDGVFPASEFALRAMEADKVLTF
ncbi:DsrE family protein [Hydrogenobacter sp. T-2]|uniref:DsrE family protein n=1 Tax=Pampinifervens diazotrophicum TaxID=1632018 RepID=UPI002B26374A|nr:DsrE family protein [Hydrogenobacter sp. T-2]WPM31500.1 DsrE family protein [Hydrogenobacter sp. T-2]